MSIHSLIYLMLIMRSRSLWQTAGLVYTLIPPSPPSSSPFGVSFYLWFKVLTLANFYHHHCTWTYSQMFHFLPCCIIQRSQIDVASSVLIHVSSCAKSSTLGSGTSTFYFSSVHLKRKCRSRCIKIFCPAGPHEDVNIVCPFQQMAIWSSFVYRDCRKS